MTDAIGRTLFRLVVSRRNLLEWVTAAQAQAQSATRPARLLSTHGASVIIAAAGNRGRRGIGQGAWPIALPFAVAVDCRAGHRTPGQRLASGRRTSAGAPPTELQFCGSSRAARGASSKLSSRRTTTCCRPTTFRKTRSRSLAHRTSPTNLGLYLLCAASARDFGWIGTPEAVERLEATLATMERLQRFRGHFYNWYDTRDLRPLDRTYVSSVDSGNLAGHLIALANACQEWIGAPVRGAAVSPASRMRCSWRASAADCCQTIARTQTMTRQQLEEALNALASAAVGSSSRPQATGAAARSAAARHDADRCARTLASEQERRGRCATCCSGRRLRSARSRAGRDDLPRSRGRKSALDRAAGARGTARAMALAMEFGFLLDPERKLLSIGYRVADGTLDPSCYDLLASEARLASFVAIAKDDVPARHWFRLGRASRRSATARR